MIFRSIFPCYNYVMIRFSLRYKFKCQLSWSVQMWCRNCAIIWFFLHTYFWLSRAKFHWFLSHSSNCNHQKRQKSSVFYLHYICTRCKGIFSFSFCFLMLPGVVALHIHWNWNLKKLASKNVIWPDCQNPWGYTSRLTSFPSAVDEPKDSTS